MKWMKAAVLEQTKQPLKILHNIRIPSLKKGQVLVKIAYAGLCHSQLMEIDGLRGEDKYLPHMLGHEGVGEVVDIGDGVSKVKAGDHVVLTWIKGEGIDAGGCQYEDESGRKINAGAITTFSNYAVISENRLVKQPQHTPDHLCVLYGCAVPTGLGMVLNTVDHSENKTVGFIGLGGIGLSALLSTKVCSFKTSIAIDINEEKLVLAKQMGVSHVLNVTSPDLKKTVLQLTNNNGLDYCFEAAGRVETIELAFDLVKRGGGKCIFASHPEAGKKICIDPFELICGKSIQGTWGGGAFPDRDIQVFDQYYQQSKLSLQDMLSKQYELENINQAIDDLKNRRIIRALVKCA